MLTGLIEEDLELIDRYTQRVPQEDGVPQDEFHKATSKDDRSDVFLVDLDLFLQCRGVCKCF